MAAPRADDPGRMLNSVVRPWLRDRVAGDYVLDGEGRAIVLAANRAIDETYASGHDHRPDLDRTRRALSGLDRLAPARRDLAVDLGCGTGWLTSALATAGGFRQVLSVDLSAAMLRGLLRRVRREGLQGVGAARADVTRLPLADGSVDCVAGNSMLHHLPDVPAFLREVARVLRPGGVLLLTHEPTVSAEALEGFLKRPAGRVYRAAKRLAGRGTPAATGAPPPFTDLWLFRCDRLDGVLAAAGFDRRVLATRGFLATPPLSFLDLASLRLTGRLPPPALHAGLRSALDALDDLGPRRLLGPDRFSSLSVAAARGPGPDAAPLPAPLASLLRCPVDHGGLEAVPAGLRNPRLGRLYPVDADGVADFDLPAGKASN